MKNYKELSDWEKAKIDKEIIETIESKHHINKHNGFVYDEPEYTLNQIHNGNYCVNCWMIYYNCLCGHD